MALEERGNQTYYYKKTRAGSRVVSEYIGNGQLALLSFEYDTQRREEENISRQHLESERAKQREIDEEVQAFCNQVRSLTTALFLVHGYHVHSRQWRKRSK